MTADRQILSVGVNEVCGLKEAGPGGHRLFSD